MSSLDKENTFRILKGQDKIQRLRCRLNWHRWTAWAINERNNDFQLPAMRCYCADCGIIRMQQPYSSSKKIKFTMKYLLLILTLLSSPSWAESHAIFDYSNNEYISVQDADTQRNIASITKLFTGVTILHSDVNMDERITVKCASRGYVIRGTEMSRRDLFTAMIVSSDNCATETLANAHPGGYMRFIRDRNEMLSTYNLKNTQLFDSTGLSVFNVSTINDLIAFAPVVYQNDFLQHVSSLPKATVHAYRKGKAIPIQLYNTNPAFGSHNNIVVSKTGYTSRAGRCVLMMVQKMENFYAVIVLGKPSSGSRSKEVEKLMALHRL